MRHSCKPHKQYFALFLCALLILSVSGCSPGDPGTLISPPPAAPTPQPQSSAPSGPNRTSANKPPVKYTVVALLGDAHNDLIDGRKIIFQHVLLYKYNAKRPLQGKEQVEQSPAV